MSPLDVKKIIAGFLGSLLIVEIGLTPIAEANQSDTIWSRRQAALEKSTNAPQLALLPSTPAVSLSALKASSAQRMSPLARQLPLQYGNIRDTYTAPHSTKQPLREMILIQDVHLNLEAQKNIVGLLEKTLSDDHTQRVYLEGACGPLALASLRRFSRPDITRRVADAFLDDNRISGPSYVSVVTPSNVGFIGADDKAHYNANVAAVRAAASEKKIRLQRHDNDGRALIERRNATFNPVLKSFHILATREDEGDLGLGAFVAALVSEADRTGVSVPANGELRRFVSAYRLETELDFKRVETERQRALQQLAAHATSAEMRELSAQAALYQSGALRYGEFYVGLKDVLARHDVSLRALPAFDAYIRYVLLSDNLNGERLLTDVQTTTNAVMTRLCKTDAERHAVADFRRWSLEGKLLAFRLTPSEWDEYKTAAQPARASDPFWSFYNEAEQRSAAIVQNVLADAAAHRVSRGVLVAGGFHTPGIAALLKKNGISYVIVSPKITKVDNGSGSDYLSIFTREKTPLEQLFQSEKLSVMPAAEILGTPEAGAQAQALALYSQGVQAHEQGASFKKQRVVVDDPAKMDKSSIVDSLPQLGLAIGHVTGRTLGSNEFLIAASLVAIFSFSVPTILMTLCYVAVVLIIRMIPKDRGGRGGTISLIAMATSMFVPSVFAGPSASLLAAQPLTGLGLAWVVIGLALIGFSYRYMRSSRDKSLTFGSWWLLPLLMWAFSRAPADTSNVSPANPPISVVTSKESRIDYEQMAFESVTRPSSIDSLPGASPVNAAVVVSHSQVASQTSAAQAQRTDNKPIAAKASKTARESKRNQPKPVYNNRAELLAALAQSEEFKASAKNSYVLIPLKNISLEIMSDAQGQLVMHALDIKVQRTASVSARWVPVEFEQLRYAVGGSGIGIRVQSQEITMAVVQSDGSKSVYSGASPDLFLRLKPGATPKQDQWIVETGLGSEPESSFVQEQKRQAEIAYERKLYAETARYFFFEDTKRKIAGNAPEVRDTELFLSWLEKHESNLRQVDPDQLRNAFRSLMADDMPGLTDAQALRLIAIRAGYPLNHGDINKYQAMLDKFDERYESDKPMSKQIKATQKALSRAWYDLKDQEKLLSRQFLKNSGATDAQAAETLSVKRVAAAISNLRRTSDSYSITNDRLDQIRTEFRSLQRQVDIDPTLAKGLEALLSQIESSINVKQEIKPKDRLERTQQLPQPKDKLDIEPTARPINPVRAAILTAMDLNSDTPIKTAMARLWIRVGQPRVATVSDIDKYILGIARLLDNEPGLKPITAPVEELLSRTRAWIVAHPARVRVLTFFHRDKKNNADHAWDLESFVESLDTNAAALPMDRQAELLPLIRQVERSAGPQEWEKIVAKSSYLQELLSKPASTSSAPSAVTVRPQEFIQPVAAKSNTASTVERKSRNEMNKWATHKASQSIAKQRVVKAPIFWIGTAFAMVILFIAPVPMSDSARVALAMLGILLDAVLFTNMAIKFFVRYWNRGKTPGILLDMPAVSVGLGGQIIGQLEKISQSQPKDTLPQDLRPFASTNIEIREIKTAADFEIVRDRIKADLESESEPQPIVYFISNPDLEETAKELIDPVRAKLPTMAYGMAGKNDLALKADGTYDLRTLFKVASEYDQADPIFGQLAIPGEAAPPGVRVDIKAVLPFTVDAALATSVWFVLPTAIVPMEQILQLAALAAKMA